MAPTISFLAGEGFTINDLAGSGLGFFGSAGFGASVRVGEYAARSFICNSAGSAAGPEVDNVLYINAGSGAIGQTGTGISLTCIPNYLATLNIRFTNDTAVQVTNWKVYGYDRVSISNSPSGVVLKACEVIHPDTSQGNSGSGDTTWTTMTGTGSYLTLANSPGPSGLYAANGTASTWSATQHDAYVCLSASPSVIGARLFAVFTSLEYL